MRSEPGEDASKSVPLDMQVEELCGSLTPHEQDFFRQKWLGQLPESAPLILEPANARQLTRRVREKAAAYVG